jgi:transmembrane sensor
MLKTKQEMEREAIGWVIRLRDAGDEDWQAFTAWLEADPLHAAAYDEAALADADAGLLAPAPSPQPIAPTAPVLPMPPARRSPTRRSFLGWAAAASIVLTGGYAVLGTGSSPYAVETAAGERRVIALDDGSSIAMNGGSRVMLDPERPRYARLEQGEALFEIRHNSARPFEVEAGGALLRDLGTVFNVVAERRRFEVAVSEGMVLFNPAREATKLTPGMQLLKMSGGSAKVSKVGLEAVGGWRAGRLVYSGAPIGVVASDLGRSLGVSIRVEEAVASRPFSGVLSLDGKPGDVLARSAALLGLHLRRSGDGWLLTRASASR